MFNVDVDVCLVAGGGGPRANEWEEWLSDKDEQQQAQAPQMEETERTQGRCLIIIKHTNLKRVPNCTMLYECFGLFVYATRIYAYWLVCIPM